MARKSTKPRAKSTRRTSKNKTTKLAVNIWSTMGVKRAKSQLRSAANAYANPRPMLEDFAKTLKNTYLKQMVRELRDQTPPRRKYPNDYPIEFTTARQQRFVMANLRGKPYVRKNKVGNGWYTRVKVNRDKISVTIGNRWPASRHVIGTFGAGTSKSSVERYMKPIQPFHLKTGWKPAYITVQDYLSRAREEGYLVTQQWLADSIGE